MTRTVADAALMFAAIAAYDATDPWSVALPPAFAKAQHQAVDLEGLRLGVVRSHFFSGDAGVIGVVDEAVDKLVTRGAKVVNLEVPDIEVAYAASRRAFLEAAALHADALEQRPGDFSDTVREKLIAAGRTSGRDYAHDQHFRQGFRQRMDALLDECDVLVTPTTCTPTPEIEAIDDAFLRRSPRNTNISDFTGQPSISLPCGFDTNQMPVGMMLTGRRFDDWRLLSQAEAIESVLGVSAHPPGY
jgi:aspartyl-tRNA(Asn)/glutamyl-tRNA(Gln) amidotransferase subunit A